MDDRRGHVRHPVWFPVSIQSAGADGIAITYDVSVGGLLVACPGTLDVGAEVTVTFRINASAPEQSVKGRVVRIEPNSGADDGPWRHRIAVEFAEPMPELESMIAAGAR